MANYYYQPTWALKLGFWQSLGKALGWDEKRCFLQKYRDNEWQYQWHRFIDHLAEGKDAESFFETLQ
jgi:hypothetical protein